MTRELFRDPFRDPYKRRLLDLARRRKIEGKPSYYSLAKDWHLPYQTVQDIEHGRSGISVASLRTYLYAMGEPDLFAIDFGAGAR